MTYTKNDILDQLDAFGGNEECQFPMLDHVYWYPVGARLSAYRDAEHWAIQFEVLAYNPRAGDHGGINLIVFPFGNCISGNHETEYLNPTCDGAEGPTFEHVGGAHYVGVTAKTIRVYEQCLPVEGDPSIYERFNVPLEESPRIEPQDLLRLLYPRFKELFYSSEDSLRKRLQFAVPLVLRLYGWQHPRLHEGELPSHSPSLVAIAEMLENGRWYDFVDPGIDNVDWRNWPAGGSL